MSVTRVARLCLLVCSNPCCFLTCCDNLILLTSSRSYVRNEKVHDAILACMDCLTKMVWFAHTHTNVPAEGGAKLLIACDPVTWMTGGCYV